MFKNKNKTLSSTTNQTKNHCEICGLTVIGSSYKFKSHLFQHGVVKPRFECKHCPSKFFRPDTYTRHMKSHYGTQVKYTCDYCGRSFVDKRNLIYHLKVHDDSFHGRPDVQFKCAACGVFYCENRLLQNHIRREHFNLKVKEVLHHKKKLNESWVEAVNDSKDYVEMTKVNNNVITIKKCVKQEYPLHKVKVHDITPMYSSRSRQYGKGKCDYCNKEMLKKSLLLHIKEKHLNVRKFHCETCKKSFKRHYQLVNHECGKIGRRRRRRNRVTENELENIKE